MVNFAIGCDAVDAGAAAVGGLEASEPDDATDGRTAALKAEDAGAGANAGGGARTGVGTCGISGGRGIFGAAIGIPAELPNRGDVEAAGAGAGGLGAKDNDDDIANGVAPVPRRVDGGSAGSAAIVDAVAFGNLPGSGVPVASGGAGGGGKKVGDSCGSRGEVALDAPSVLAVFEAIAAGIANGGAGGGGNTDEPAGVENANGGLTRGIDVEEVVLRFSTSAMTRSIRVWVSNGLDNAPLEPTSCPRASSYG